MARTAKSRKKTTRRKRPAKRTQAQSSLPGWVWMLFGLAIGLAVAVGIYVNDRGKLRELAKSPETAPVRVEQARPEPQVTEPEESKFAFYDLLPNFEVVIPEEDLEVRRNVPDTPVDAPGSYVLQAGSFSQFEDADRMKAQLALLGMLANVQRVTVDDKVYHRVRVGPLDDLGALNDYRTRLREAEIEALIIRVPQ